MESPLCKGNEVAGENEEIFNQPLSPNAQYYSSSVMSLSILGVFEYAVPIDDVSHVLTSLKGLFLPMNPRFSSIIVTDEQGVKRWRKVKVNVDDHLKVPIFQDDLSTESYHIHLQDYMSKLAMERLPQNRPLWEVHIFNYPTSSTAVSTSIFKFHHALGDGYSLVGALLSSTRRADDPSLPLTFPSLRSIHQKRNNMFNSVLHYSSVFYNTTLDFISSLLKSTVVADDLTPIRSGADDLEFGPYMISTTTFTIDQIKQIKAKLGGTLNDIMVGTIFYGIRLYMQSVSKDSSHASSTALVIFNTRVINGYHTVEEMVKPDAQSLWGNKFTFFLVSVPKSKDVETEDPLEFISKTRNAMDRKKRSIAVHLNARMLEMIRKLRGPEAVSRFIYGIARNTSLMISNVMGPIEQIAMADYPCTGMYFMAINLPQTLEITMMSYMGNLRVAIGGEKDYMNQELLVSCIEKAFQLIFQAALTKKI